jgi:hypothetical protein
MIGHVDEKRGLAVCVRGRRGLGGVGCVGVALGVLASAGLVGAGQARAQNGEPPQPGRGAAAPLPPPPPGDAPLAKASGATPAAEPSEMPPLADDDAVTVPSPASAATSASAGASNQDEPWSRGVDIAQRQAARQMFLQANDSARKRYFATAVARYKRAFQLWSHPAFAYNLALAQRQLDQPVEAHASLERAIAHGPEPLAGRYDQAQQQLALIEAELALVEVTCDEPGAHVMLNGKLLFTGPGRYRGVARPGVHQLVATQRGLVPVVEQIVLSPGEPAQFALAFAQPESNAARWRNRAASAAAGAGIVLLVAGGALDWHSSRVFDEYEHDLVRGCAMGCRGGVPPQIESRRTRAVNEQRAAVAAYAVGGAALATSVVLILLDRERTPRRRARPAAERETSAPRSSVAPLVSPGVIGVSAGFRF